jgi:hypothetical protein
LPSNDQVLLHLSSDLDLGGVSLSSLPASSAAPRTATHHANRPVTIDRSILPSASEITALFQHFQGYTSAAFPIFYMPDLRAWTEDVCFKGAPVEAEVACAVLCECRVGWRPDYYFAWQDRADGSGTGCIGDVVAARIGARAPEKRSG